MAAGDVGSFRWAQKYCFGQRNFQRISLWHTRGYCARDKTDWFWSIVSSPHLVLMTVLRLPLRALKRLLQFGSMTHRTTDHGLPITSQLEAKIFSGYDGCPDRDLTGARNVRGGSGVNVNTASRYFSSSVSYKTFWKGWQACTGGFVDLIGGIVFSLAVNYLGNGARRAVLEACAVLIYYASWSQGHCRRWYVHLLKQSWFKLPFSVLWGFIVVLLPVTPLDAAVEIIVEVPSFDELGILYQSCWYHENGFILSRYAPLSWLFSHNPIFGLGYFCWK